jgi:hypothetical protein
LKPHAPDPWHPLRQHLQQVLAGLTELQAVADLAPTSPEHATQLAHGCAAFAQVLGALPSAPPPALPLPADLRLALEQLSAGLSALRLSVSRLGTGTERALGELFPTEQVNAYARLGGRTPYAGGPRGSGQANYTA